MKRKSFQRFLNWGNDKTNIQRELKKASWKIVVCPVTKIALMENRYLFGSRKKLLVKIDYFSGKL